MIRHFVLWTLKAEDAAGKARSVEAIAGVLEPLVGVIGELKSLKVSANVAPIEANWDAMLVADFDSVADLATYLVHPEHVKAVTTVRQHTVQRAAVDIEL